MVFNYPNTPLLAAGCWHGTYTISFTGAIINNAFFDIPFVIKILENNFHIFLSVFTLGEPYPLKASL